MAQKGNWSPETIGWPHLQVVAMWFASVWLAVTLAAVEGGMTTLPQKSTNQAIIHLYGHSFVIIALTVALLKDLQQRPFFGLLIAAGSTLIIFPQPSLHIIWQFLPVDLSMMAAAGWGVIAWECNSRHLRSPTKMQYEVTLEQTALAAVTLSLFASINNLVFASGDWVAPATLLALLVMGALATFVITSHRRSLAAARVAKKRS